MVEAPAVDGPPERPRRTAAVRFRITALAALAVAAVLGGTGVALVAVQARVLTNSLDASLNQRAEDLAALVAAGPSSGALPGDDDDIVAQVVDGDGRVLAASPALAGEPALRLPADTPAEPVDVEVDGDDYRALARPVDVPGGRATLYVVGELDDIRESVAILATSLLVAVPVAVAALAALVWWLAGRTLRPVEAIRAEVAGMDGTDLGRRVPVPPSGDEVAQLARTMNDMLDRVERASRHQQRFVADASHELRSPLARMRAELEVDDTHPVTSDPTVTRRSVLTEVVGLQHLVDDLLYLARADAEGGAETAVPALRPVDLDDIVLAEAVGRRRSADGATPTLDTSAVTAAQVLGRRDDLARVVTNLVDNAVRHARTRVSLSLREDGDVAVLVVADDGSGIPPDQAEWVFGRFTRLDPARAGATGGTGLGLAIARDIVERHGGTIAVDTGTAAGARMVVTLPLAPDS
jgi:signal transduction histidine kinase